MKNKSIDKYRHALHHLVRKNKTNKQKNCQSRYRVNNTCCAYISDYDTYPVYKVANWRPIKWRQNAQIGSCIYILWWYLVFLTRPLTHALTHALTPISCRCILLRYSSSLETVLLHDTETIFPSLINPHQPQYWKQLGSLDSLP